MPCYLTKMGTPAPATSYQQLVLSNAPVAYYQLGDTGTTLTDSGPNAVAGTYGSAVVRQAAPITAGATAAAVFPGGSTFNPQGYAYTPRSAFLEPSCPTIEAWFSLNAPNSTNGEIPIVVYGTINNGVRYGLYLHGLSGGQQCLELQLRAIGQPKSLQVLSRGRFSVNTPYHVVVTFDGVEVAIYINGKLDTDFTYLGNIDYSPAFKDGLQIGGGNQPAPPSPYALSDSFPGTIAQVAVYPLPLSATDVQNHYLAGKFSMSMTERPIAADTFVDSIGLNAHFDRATSIYVESFPQIKQLLATSGIRHLRATMIFGDPAYLDRMNQLGAVGLHASYLTRLGMTQAQIQSWPATVGPSFEQFEAPNELDDVGNPDWIPGCIAFEQNLYSWVKSDPQIARYQVVGPSIVSSGHALELGNLSSYLDVGNIHDYFFSYNPGTPGWGNIHPPFGIFGSIPFNMNYARVVSGNKPIEATETGYASLLGDPLTLDYRMHMRYETRLLFEQLNNGVTRTYIYELVDESGSSSFGSYGLVTDTIMPKPAFTGIVSLIAQLKDPGAPFLRTPLTYDIIGSSEDPIHHTLLQKRNGHYVLAIWLEVPDWLTQNGATGEIIVPPVTVTLKTARNFSNATIATMDDSGNMTSAPLAWTGTSAPVSVSDKVSLIDLAP